MALETLVQDAPQVDRYTAGTTAMYTPQPDVGPAPITPSTLPGPGSVLPDPAGQYVERYGYLQERVDATRVNDLHLNYDVVGAKDRTILGDAHRIDL